MEKLCSCCKTFIVVPGDDLCVLCLDVTNIFKKIKKEEERMYKCQHCEESFDEFNGCCPNCGSVLIDSDFNSTTLMGCSGDKRCDDCTCDDNDCDEKFVCKRCNCEWSDEDAKSCPFCGGTEKEKVACNHSDKDSGGDGGDSGCGGGGCGGCGH